MAKLTLTDISAGYDTATINAANNLLIETAMENTLSRDGTSPNQMEANLDMNSYRIQNLPNAVNNSEPVVLGQATTLAGVTNPLTQNSIGTTLYPQSAAETTAGVTPTNYYYPPGNVLRYGADNTGSTDCTAEIQEAIDCGESEIVFPTGDYLVSKTALYTTEFPNGDQPCVFVENKTRMVLRGEGNARLVVNEHAQGIMEMQGCTDCDVIGLHFVGPTDFPDLDGTTGRGEKGTATNGYDTSSIWGNNKNNSSDTSANTGGGFGGNFPVYGDVTTSSSWGTWNDGYIGNVSFGLLIQKGCVRVTVERCFASGFNYCGFGVGHLNDSTYTTNEEIKFLTCTARGNYSAGIHSMAVDGLLVKGCTLSGNGHPDADPENETYADPGYGYTARGIATYYTKNAVIEGNTVEDNIRKGIDSHASLGLQISDNTIRNCGALGIGTIWTNATQPVIGTTIKNNRIYNCSYGTNDLGGIVGGGAIDGAYSYANSLCDLTIEGNHIIDCGGPGIQIYNGRNIQIVNNILRGFDDRATGSEYFMFLGRVSASEDLNNLNVSGNVCDADGDASRYRGIYVRRANNSQVNHNMVYLDHASASEGVRIAESTSCNSFGNIVHWDAGAATGNPLNLLGTDAFTVGNYADPDAGTLSYPFGNEGTTGEKEHAVRVPHIIQLDITFNSTTSPSYTVNAGEDYVASVGELATYGAQVTFQNIHSTAVLRSSIIDRSADGLESASGDITFIYERAISNTALEIGLKTNASGTNIIASNCTGGTIGVTIFVF